MRKGITKVLAAGAALTMMISAPAMAMNAEEISQKAQESLKDVQQYTMSFDADADLTMDVAQGEADDAQTQIPVKGTATGKMALTLEPLAVSSDVTFEGSAMGQEMSGASQTYIVSQDDGTAIMYTKAQINGEDTGWTASKVDADKTAEIMDAVNTLKNDGTEAFIDKYAGKDGSIDASQMKSVMTEMTDLINAGAEVSEEPVDADGTSCYEIKYDLDGNTLGDLFTKTMAVAGSKAQALDESTLAMAQSIVSMLDLRIDTFYDAQTCLPLMGSIDLAGSDFSMLGQMFGSMTGAEGATADVSVNALGLNYKADYTTPVEVTVPEEALAAPVQEDGFSIEEIESLTDGTGMETEADFDGGDIALDPEDEPVVNDDGSYHIEDENYEGEKLVFDVHIPEDMDVNYASKHSVYFMDEDFENTVSYAAVAYSNADDVLKGDTDTSYMEEREDYSDIKVSDIKEIALDNGNTVKYATVSYNYGEYPTSRTYAVIPADDMAVAIEIEKQDSSFNPVEVTEEDVVNYAEAVTIAG